VKLSFSVEQAAVVLRDAAELFPLQWQELGLNKDKIAGIAPNEEQYRLLEQEGHLHCVTVRIDGKMVGYYISSVLNHLHYKDAGLMAFTDLYFLSPEYRRGGIGTKMLLFLEQTLKARGVVKIYLSTKAHADNGPLFEALGYRFTDRIFAKYVGE